MWKNSKCFVILVGARNSVLGYGAFLCSKLISISAKSAKYPLGRGFCTVLCLRTRILDWRLGNFRFKAIGRRFYMPSSQTCVLEAFPMFLEMERDMRKLTYPDPGPIPGQCWINIALEQWRAACAYTVNYKLKVSNHWWV